MSIIELNELVRRLDFSHLQEMGEDPPLLREWLVTNGLGGYASGTIAGVTTRRYHGLLIAALPAPLGRIMMFNHLSEQVRLRDGAVVRFDGEEWVGGRLDLHGSSHLQEFRLEGGLPVWRFALGDALLEKRLFMPYGQNTVHVTYRLLSGPGMVRLKLRPAVSFRSHDGPVSAPLDEPYTVTVVNERCELRSAGELPPLRFHVVGERPALTIEGQKLRELLYRVEGARGYDSAGDLWAPGYFRVDVTPERPATLIASTEPWEVMLALAPEEAFAAERRRRVRLLELAGPSTRRRRGRRGRKCAR